MSVWPRAMSEPANEMFWPGPTTRLTRIAPSPSGSVCSIMMTASAPRGIGAPVATGVAAPAFTGSLGFTPHGTISPDSTRRAGVLVDAFARSAARTAKPSTTERSNGGASTGAVTSLASTRLSRRSSGTVSVSSGAGFSASRNSAIAASRDMTSRNWSCAIALLGGFEVMASRPADRGRMDRRD